MPNLSPPDLPPLAEEEDGVDDALAAVLPDVSKSQSFIAVCVFSGYFLIVEVHNKHLRVTAKYVILYGDMSVGESCPLYFHKNVR